MGNFQHKPGEEHTVLSGGVLPATRSRSRDYARGISDSAAVAYPGYNSGNRTADETSETGRASAFPVRERGSRSRNRTLRRVRGSTRSAGSAQEAKVTHGWNR